MEYEWNEGPIFVKKISREELMFLVMVNTGETLQNSKNVLSQKNWETSILLCGKQ